MKFILCLSASLVFNFYTTSAFAKDEDSELRRSVYIVIESSDCKGKPLSFLTFETDSTDDKQRFAVADGSDDRLPILTVAATGERASSRLCKRTTGSAGALEQVWFNDKNKNGNYESDEVVAIEKNCLEKDVSGRYPGKDVSEINYVDSDNTSDRVCAYRLETKEESYPPFGE